MLPALSESSFSAQRMFRSNLEGNQLLVAFEQQATIVFHAAMGLVRRTIKEGHQLVLNGVHIVPGLIDVPADWPFFQYMRDSFDALYAEGEEAPKMMSIGMHCRLLGRPWRITALQRFLDHIARHDRVWVCTRLDIARHWKQVHPYPEG